METSNCVQMVWSSIDTHQRTVKCAHVHWTYFTLCAGHVFLSLSLVCFDIVVLYVCVCILQRRFAHRGRRNQPQRHTSSQDSRDSLRRGAHPIPGGK